MKMVLWTISSLVVIGILFLFAPRIVHAPLFLALSNAFEAREAKIIFTGDLMFDRYVRTKALQFGEEHTLDGVAEFLAQADFVVGNLEGPITSFPSVSAHTTVGDPQNMRFTFPTTTPQLLQRYNFGLVSLGNNHMFDFGPEGVEETKQLLASAGIEIIGDPLRTAPDIVVQEVRGIRIAFIAYNEFFGQSLEDVEEAVRVAKETKEPNAVVVIAHWGEEYLENPPERIRNAGRRFIDAGANLVIGSHPHVVQPYEDYGGGRMYYSLGNFVFDQYWNEAVRCGQAVIAVFSPSGITYAEQDIGMEKDGSTVLGCK